MDISKQITYYLQGKLSEEEAMELWLHLFMNPDELEVLEMQWKKASTVWVYWVSKTSCAATNEKN